VYHSHHLEDLLEPRLAGFNKPKHVTKD